MAEFGKNTRHIIIFLPHYTWAENNKIIKYNLTRSDQKNDNTNKLPCEPSENECKTHNNGGDASKNIKMTQYHKKLRIKYLLNWVCHYAAVTERTESVRDSKHNRKQHRTGLVTKTQMPTKSRSIQHQTNHKN